jgi:hypothetical protein
MKNIYFTGEENKLCLNKGNKISAKNCNSLLIFLGKKNKLCSLKGNKISFENIKLIRY